MLVADIDSAASELFSLAGSDDRFIWWYMAMWPVYWASLVIPLDRAARITVGPGMTTVTNRWPTRCRECLGATAHERFYQVQVGFYALCALTQEQARFPRVGLEHSGRSPSELMSARDMVLASMMAHPSRQGKVA